MREWGMHSKHRGTARQLARRSGEGLGARRQKPELFLEGDYRPLEITGNNKDRVIAFARIHESDWAIAVVVRCVASLDAPVLGDERRRFWEGMTLALPEHSPADWVNLLAGKDSASISSNRGCLSLGHVFAGFPLRSSFPARTGERLDDATWPIIEARAA